MLHDFCLSPRLTENPALLYGSLPPNYHLPKPVPTRSQKRSTSAYRFSLAFQCIVNIGVRSFLPPNYHPPKPVPTRSQKSSTSTPPIVSLSHFSASSTSASAAVGLLVNNDPHGVYASSQTKARHITRSAERVVQVSSPLCVV